MIKIVEGDMFKGGHQALVNPVNLTGKMGALAGVFLEKFPEECKLYQELCEEKKFKFGDVLTVPTNTPFNFHKYIIHFPTNPDSGEASDIRYIAMGMQTLLKHVIDLKITNIAIPALGCGVGGLDFKPVSEIIMTYMKEADNCDTFIYKPH